MINIHFYKTFLGNKYSKWYLSIIVAAQSKNRKKSEDCYYERHHIIPKSINPEISNLKLNPWNGVLLTAKEHFICHLLLTKMAIGKDKNKMIYALWNLRNQKTKSQDQRFTSNLYNVYKKQMQEALSVDRKGKSLEERYGITRASEIKASYRTRIPRGKVSNEEKGKLSENMKTLHQTRPWKRFMQTNGVLPKNTCPHCNKTMDVGNYGRYHGDKCKLREISK